MSGHVYQLHISHFLFNHDAYISLVDSNALHRIKNSVVQLVFGFSFLLGQQWHLVFLHRIHRCHPGVVDVCLFYINVQVDEFLIYVLFGIHDFISLHHTYYYHLHQRRLLIFLILLFHSYRPALVSL